MQQIGKCFEFNGIKRRGHDFSSVVGLGYCFKSPRDPQLEMSTAGRALWGIGVARLASSEYNSIGIRADVRKTGGNLANTAQSRQILGTLLLLGTPFWQRSRGRRAARFIVLASYIYIVAMLALLALEDLLLFPGATVRPPWCEPPDYLGVRERIFDSATGDCIHAWFSAPKGWEPHRGAILISHGNGNNLSSESGRAYRWREASGRAVLLYDYPGYGKSSGRPSEKGCFEAGEAALNWLIEDQGVPAAEIILVGESMGGAIAVELATRHKVRMLVLHGAFTSFPDMAQVRFPCFPSRYLVHNRMENEAKISLARCPVLITHGTADSIVPFSQGERLFAAAHEPKQFVRMEGHGHGPPTDEEFFQTVRLFLSETAR
jgi:pimeloyl-ACP methyl ester carboxylesterase